MDAMWSSGFVCDALIHILKPIGFVTEHSAYVALRFRIKFLREKKVEVPVQKL